MSKVFSVIAAVAALGFGAAPAFASASEASAGTAIPEGGSTLAFSLEEMNCMSTDLHVTNSIPCSSKGTNSGKPSTKRR